MKKRNHDLLEIRPLKKNIPSGLTALDIALYKKNTRIAAMLHKAFKRYSQQQDLRTLSLRDDSSEAGPASTANTQVPDQQSTTTTTQDDPEPTHQDTPSEQAIAEILLIL